MYTCKIGTCPSGKNECCYTCEDNETCDNGAKCILPAGEDSETCEELGIENE